MNFGPRTSEAESFDILNASIEAGINFIDTANQYGGHLGVGTTEKILGKWFAEDKARRGKLVLATKVYEPMSDDPKDRGLSEQHILDACDASLQRLGVDHIDLYQMHHIDRSVPLEETWSAMEKLISQGKIRYAGSSNFPGWAIAKANEQAVSRDQFQLVSEQSLYNLIERRVELEVLPACREYGMALIPWSPLAGGLLAGGANGTSGRRQSDEAQSAFANHGDQLLRFERLCADLELSPSSMALAWLLHQPGVAATIIGPASVDQLVSVLDVPDLELTTDTLDRLDAIFPPQGEAPEAYAW
ncbi:MAG: aldo/keto reductase [Parasphingorhabdus sp.]